MIFDKIENWSKYFKNSIFSEIFDKLSKLDVNTKNGNYYQGNGYYFKVMSYSTKSNPSIIESHKEEVDIQILLSGSEHIKIYSSDQVEVTSEYNQEIDCKFYKSKETPKLELNLFSGYMAVFFPQDIHECQHTVGGHPENIKKIVIKVNEKFFT